MSYLIDTDWVIDHLTGVAGAHALISALASDGVAISIITFSEVYEGIYTSRDPERAEHSFQTFLRGVRVLGISREVARQNARIRGELRNSKHQITHRALDLFIAATALTHDLTLVTRNSDHFNDIPALRIYQ